jgi:type IV secretion system protein TrbL
MDLKKRWTLTIIFLFLLVIASPLSAFAAPSIAVPADQPNMVLQQFANAQAQWMTVAMKYANTLFGLLAIIEFVWLWSVLAMEGPDMTTILATTIKKMMTVGFFYALLMFADVGPFGTQGWIPAIINSFTRIGIESANASGAAISSAGLTPAGIMYQGVEIATKLVKGFSSNFLSYIPGFTMGASIITVLASMIVLLAYCMITLSFIMAKIESFIVLGAGLIFLGFGGSRWTSNYVERYLALAVSTGVRLMVLYMIIGLGQGFGNQWMQAAANAGSTDSGIQTMFGIVCGAITFMGVAWKVPSMVAGVLGGSLQMSGGDAIAPAMTLAAGAATAGAAVASGGAALAAAGAASAAGGAAGAAGGAATSAAAVAGNSGTLMAGETAANSASNLAATTANVGGAVNPPAGPPASPGGNDVMPGGPTPVDPPNDIPAGNGGQNPPAAPSNGQLSSTGNSPKSNGSSASEGTSDAGSNGSRAGSAGAAAADAGARGEVNPPVAPTGENTVTASHTSSSAAQSSPGATSTDAAPGNADAAAPETKPDVSGVGNEKKPGLGFQDVANTLRTARDESNTLANHLQPDAPAATSAHLNIGHGE